MSRFGIGQPALRVEDARFLTGSGRYVDDIRLPRECHGVVVLSPHPHALIRHIDVAAALAWPGVLCVLTGEEAAGLGSFPPLFIPEDGRRAHRPVLARDLARCVGDRVAFVVAETLEQARDAAEQLVVDYEPLPAVVDVADAAAEQENISFRIEKGDGGATEAAFARAAHIVRVHLVNNRLAPNPIEPRAAIGDYDAAEDRFTLYTTSQNPHGARSLLAGAIFRMPETKLRVVSPDVGGGFGLKTNPYPEDALVLWASRRVGRPVRWTATRSESLLGDNHGRDQVVDGELALDRDGCILAVRSRALHAIGAYTFSACAAPIEFAVNLIPNVYEVPAVHLVAMGVFTHTSPLSAYRGAGRPEAVYLIERLLDHAAQELGLDPAEIRRRNFIRRLPHRTATGYAYDSGDFAKVLDTCLEHIDWRGFPERKKASRALRGRGVACYIEHGGRMNERMEVRFDPSGALTIVAGTHSHGQGHATTYAQMAHEWLGVPFERIRVVQGDTDAVPYGRGTFAARSSMLGGCALKAAADGIVEKAKPMAAQLLEASAADLEFKGGRFNVMGTDHGVTLTEVAKAFYRPFGPHAGLEASGSYNAEPPNHPNGCHACEVEVDPETGRVTIERYAVVDDVGRVINPMICEGQVHGGLAQGIGQALLEQVAYDRESGQLLSGSFMDYGMPRAADMPSPSLAFVEIPATTNPLGVKGIGEAGAIGSPPALVNAILDALRPLGVTQIDMPATPHRVWRAIMEAKCRTSAGS